VAIIKYSIIFVGLLSIQLLFTNAINVNSIYVFAQDAITHLHPIAAEILKIKANIPNPSQFSFVVDNINQNLNNTTPMLSNTTSLGLNNTTPMLSNTTSLGLNNTVPVVSSTAPNVNNELTPVAFVPTYSETSHLSNSKNVDNHDTTSSEDKDTHSAKDKDTHSAKDKDTHSAKDTSIQAIHHSTPSKDLKKSLSDSETSHISNSKNVNHHSTPSKDLKKSSNEDNDEGKDSDYADTLFY